MSLGDLYWPLTYYYNSLSESIYVDYIWLYDWRCIYFDNYHNSCFMVWSFVGCWILCRQLIPKRPRTLPCAMVSVLSMVSRYSRTVAFLTQSKVGGWQCSDLIWSNLITWGGVTRLALYDALVAVRGYAARNLQVVAELPALTGRLLVILGIIKTIINNNNSMEYLQFILTTRYKHDSPYWL